ncbi:hypothetical protein IM660_01825 [Ruania alkalisoli]|uniref:SD-repeat containing protein B domain-containing protein n=1 Tax=Ruania alkalisoli TaxID=2779775 RepID=A0A7M1SU08_9MICO|nr:SdrD B-like domain-containing protein [Ruania alkalisoli]QOR71079.1 hypothetical protein IM660_01825 [Ruania alkalisoli]
MKPWRSVVAGLATLVLGAMFVSVGPGVSDSRAAAGDGVLTVQVDRDFSGDGVYDASYDPPQAGIDVSVTDGTDTVGPLVTNSLGQVSFDLSDLSGESFRVDVAVTDPELDYLQAAPAATADVADAFRSFTTFVGGETQTIHVGVWNPDTFVPEAAPLAVVQQTDRSAAGDIRSLMVTDWDNRGPTTDDTGDNTNGITTVATQEETGTVFGTAWDHTTNEIYSAAYAKAHTVYGPGGSGGIYRTDVDGGGPGNTELWATVPNAGTSAHQTEDGYDDDFFMANGREGLGGLALSEDESTLYVVNLNDRSLYTYATSDSAPATPVESVPITDPGCVGGQWRPFSVTVRDGGIYVGGVCDASSSLSRSNLTAHVLQFDDGAFTSIFSKDLDFRRGNQNYSDPTPNLVGPNVATNWNPWRTSWDADLADYFDAGPLYPTPMLTSVVFENDGSMILGFRDRTPDMLVRHGFSPDPDNRTSITGVIVGGDINKVCLTDGVYEWEGAGSCGDNSTPANSGGEPVDRVEFFPGDFFDASIRYPSSTVRHLENSMGGLVLNPRQPDIANTTMDASGLFNTGGIGFYDREVGTGPGNEPLDRGLLVAGNETYNFGKGSGLGGLSLLAAAAPSQIGNRVWFDTDQDGQQDPSDEPAVAGATVRLLSSDGMTVLAETVTDENGEYYFGGDGGYALEPGIEYVVEFDVTTVDTASLPGAPPLDELQFTLSQAAGVPDELDSNPTPTADALIARANVIGPEVGEVDHTIDAGIYVPSLSVSVGDLVWLDEDRDGLQGDGEPGIEGVELTLTGPDGEPVTDVFGNLVEPVFTDEAGEYSFDNLPALDEGESYTVTVTPPVGFDPTVEGAGDDPALDSSTGSATSGDLTGDGDRDPSLDFGFVPDLVSVGDYVWIDADRDGIQDEGEAPVEGVEVTLLDSDGEVVATTVTDADGYYVFTDLPISTEFTIEFPTTVEVDGQDYPLTQAQVGDDPGVDSNPGADGTFSFTTPATGENSGEPGQADDPTIDAGYVSPSVSVGDLVWLDEDRDGLQGDGEPGIEGVELTLTGPDGEPVTDVFGNLVEPVFTDEAGEYSFDNLPALDEGESYTVTVTPPVGFDPTVEGAGDDPALDSSTGSATSGDLTGDGDRDPSLDFGFVPDLVSVGDYVWIDADRDGIQDEGEAPVEGVEVTLLDSDGEVVATTVTDADGYYVFTDLPISTEFTIEFPTTITVNGETYPLTTAGAGSDTGLDSNPDQNTGRYSFTTPATGENSGEPGQADMPTIDAGYTPALVGGPSPSPTDTPPVSEPTEPLPGTGASGSLLLIGGLAALVLLVGILLRAARQRAVRS